MSTQTPTLDEVRQWPATVAVAEAAKALGVSSSALYVLIRGNEAPVRVLQLGKGSKRVVTASLVRVLEGGAP
ncbi:DNA-binding protein [Streptomyces prunicolor]|uniref:DNA-binding protein n=1 Tax=Streptomyces prunicolor TaxID=67348 RepID=UPI00225BB21B|nr:DNA-binding protein [Streptomyces prunicolor]MCX5239852.1 DNA-binding protein [Streptomyces prunicolor]